jgi:hypothetical protein
MTEQTPISREVNYVYVNVSNERVIRQDCSPDATYAWCLHPCDAANPRSGQNRNLLSQNLTYAAVQAGGLGDEIARDGEGDVSDAFWPGRRRALPASDRGSPSRGHRVSGRRSFGVDHPQLPHLEEALARAGFAALIYWSPVMRDLRLDPQDIENIALAYHWLLEQPYVDPGRSGLIGTCVGDSFALMAAASPLIRDRVAFVGGFAPYASMWTFARDIASATRLLGEVREPWQVDQLTRKVYVRTLTSFLEPSEAERLRNAFTDQGGQIDSRGLSEEGRALYPLLTALSADDAERALHRLPPAIQESLTALSPLSYLEDIHAPLIVFGDDRDDLVIPVSESRQLWSALSGRAGVQYTEFAMFQHLDPTKRKLPLFQFVQQLGKFFLYVYPMFRQAVTV